MFSSLPGSYYNPTKDYSYHGNYGYTPLGSTTTGAWDNLSWIQGEQDQKGSWTKLLAGMGLGGQDMQSLWSQGQMPQANAGYGAAQLQEPNLQWQDYIKGLNLNEIYNAQGPAGRGINSGQYVGKARWQRRN